jgi:hypothetical protein
MAQTGISLSSAQNAGAIATQILAITAAITALNNAVAAGNPIVTSIILNLPGSQPDIMAGVKLNAADSATILNNIFGAYQNLLSQYNAQLASLPIT